jgi:hypothetical protein
MAVKRVSVQNVEIEDKPGSLQKFLTQCSLSNVDFLCFAALSTGAGRGEIYLSAKDPETFKAFAQDAGLAVTDAVGFIVADEDKIGAAAEALKGLAEAGITGLAGSAMVSDGQYRMLIVVGADDGDAAEKALGA